MVVLCIMHIYAHILAAEDDEAEGCANCGGPYLCKCPRIRVAPCATFLEPDGLAQQIDFVSCISPIPRGGRGAEKRGIEVENGGGKDGAARRRIRVHRYPSFAKVGKAGKILAVKPVPSVLLLGRGRRERTISISRRDFSYIARHIERFTSNLFLSFRGNRSPMTFSHSFLGGSMRFSARSVRQISVRRSCSRRLLPFRQERVQARRGQPPFFHRPIVAWRWLPPPLGCELARPMGGAERR